MSVVPAISIVMPVYNAAPYLVESIDSILAQTFANFEFIIIDDASTDATPDIIADYAKRDNRIHLLTNGSNIKIAASLNRGLDAARAPLLARMDADDWAHPERLAKQYAFMQAHPEVTVCGTWLETYETGDVWRYPESDSAIRAELFLSSPFGHPTVMFRKQIIMLCCGYDVSMPPAEDYDLWVRLAKSRQAIFANIPETLIRYRIHPHKERIEYLCKMEKQANTVRLKLCQFFWDGTFSDDKQKYFLILYNSGSLMPNEIDYMIEYVYAVIAQNERVQFVSKQYIVAQLCGRWANICMNFSPKFYYYFIIRSFLSLLKCSDKLAWKLARIVLQVAFKRLAITMLQGGKSLVRGSVLAVKNLYVFSR